MNIVMMPGDDIGPEIVEAEIAKAVAISGGLGLSTAMLFEWLGVKHALPALVDASTAITTAVDVALADDGARTGDLGGRGNTRLFAERVVAALA